jgi:uracil-DNA glycosylase family 4
VTQYSLFDDNLEAKEFRAEAERASAEAVEAPGEPTAPDAGTEAAEDKTAQMAQLREPALVCTKCDLSLTRTHVVFGEGNVEAPLVLVGEGPGETEDATGRPFVGRAGVLLDEVLRENGMNRGHVYICNVLKCRAANLENGRWMNRPPRVEETAACRGWLEAQLRIIRPLVIVCIGGPAAGLLIRPGFPITRERGRWFTDNPHAPWVMAALHPAYILRLSGEAYDTARRSLVEDIGSARRKVIEARKQKPAALF